MLPIRQFHFKQVVKEYPDAIFRDYSDNARAYSGQETKKLGAAKFLNLPY
jgi:hypothetical protein